MLLLTLFVCACAGVSEEPRPISIDDLAGSCWELTVGEWPESPYLRGTESGLYPIPMKFQLRSDFGHSAFERGRRLVHPRMDFDYESWASWNVVRGDSVEIAWSMGYGGNRLVMSLKNRDHMKGRGRLGVFG